MAWLIIIFVVAVVLSPIMWFKQSPKQKNKGVLREAARKRNLQVSLDRRPDAREDESSLTVVCYQLYCGGKTSADNWVLHRHSQRGWDSDWDSWRWYDNQASAEWHPVLAETINGMPLGVTAVICSDNSVGMVWDESGGLDQLHLIHEKLQQLRKQWQNNY
jgi:hypothetical protein